ncbi:unnamed protein product [Adineta steineri]|uniref:FAD-binding domain-containing protein n=1 Tax=Adineta steineri TaxID=433720 RepID=A0A813ZNQ6_9BILA|nr:unnamed protein product [Adineta steineri]CAF0902085.1 unnamed protein product [Adineta steineri]CAF0928687.1 unnamed protein product [Adineta steineri]
MSTSKSNSANTSATASEKSNSTSDANSDNFMTNEVNKGNSEIIDVLVAGAGIGGLITALCLHRAGFTVRVYEQAHILKPIGFAMNLQPYCVKLLYELGLKDELDKIGIRTSTAAYYSRNGQFIYKESRGIDAGYGWPQYSIHHGYLQELLVRHMHDEVGKSSIQLSQKVVAFRMQQNHVEVDFVNPDTDQLTTALAKVLVGADGIKSAVRKILYPTESPPLWNGCSLWRGLTQMDKTFFDGRTMIYLGNPNERFIAFYPIGNNLINWVCVIQTEEPGRRVPPEMPDCDTMGHIQNLLPLISDMKLDFLDVHHLISSSLIVRCYPVTDRDTLVQWTHDRVTLLGDAAHPMYPYGSNGASQAIVDARALTLSFREHGVTPQSLKAYDNLRREVSNNFVLSAREHSSLNILQIIDEHSPSSFWRLSDIISESEVDAELSKHKQACDWNAQQLKQEPPLF